jgi:hypothetical protein
LSTSLDLSTLVRFGIADAIMAGVINKRQQVRNERALQELIRTVPGNDKCAECGAKNPGMTLILHQKDC